MKVRLISKVVDLPDVHSFIFQPEQPLSWLPGQYMQYTLNHPGMDERGEKRWFTISAAPFEKNLMITTRLTAGSGSTFKKALDNLKAGDQIEAEGPKGSFTLEEGSFRHVLIAGGIGITPYRSMLLQLDHDGKDPQIELFYANRDENLVFGQLLRVLESKLSNFALRSFTGGKRIVADDLKEYVGRDDAIFYISGPRPMVEGYQHLLQSLNVPEERIKTDYFPGYGS